MSSNIAENTTTTVKTKSTKSLIANIALWIVQVLVALVFAFSGIAKFTTPADVLTANSPFPLQFTQFIGVCEILGALGLLLPGIFRIQRRLTPLAAAGLVIIMIGATVTTITSSMAFMAPVTAVLGLLCALILYGRRSWFTEK